MTQGAPIKPRGHATSRTGLGHAPPLTVIPAYAGIQETKPPDTTTEQVLPTEQRTLQLADDTIKPGSFNGMKQPCVYLLASRRNGTLYVGDQ